MKFLNKIDGASKIITDSNNQFVTQAEKDEIAKVKDKVDKGQVLTNVPSGAKFTDTIYTHPTNHQASMITESAIKRFVTDAEKANWNNKADKTYVDNKLPSKFTWGDLKG